MALLLLLAISGGPVPPSAAAAVDSRHFVSVHVPGQVVAVSCVSPLGVSSRLFRPAVVRAVADVKTVLLQNRFPNGSGYRVTGVVGADFGVFRVVGPKSKIADLLTACEAIQRISPVKALPTAASFRMGPLTPRDQFAYPVGSPTRRGFAESTDDASVKEVNVALKSQISNEVSTVAVAGEFGLSSVVRWATKFRFGRLPTKQERFRVFEISPGILDMPGISGDTYVWKLDTASLNAAECWRVAAIEKMQQISQQYPKALTKDFQMREVNAMEGSFFAFDMEHVSNTLDRIGILEILKSDYKGPSGPSQPPPEPFTPSDTVARTSSRRATDLFLWGVPVFPVRENLTSRDCPSVGFPTEKALRLY